MACLGGKCPLKVVTGLKPRYPATLTAGLPVTMRDVNSYVKDLAEHVKTTQSIVRAAALAQMERDAKAMGGRLSCELEVGDAVLVKREPTARREGPTRFQDRTYPGIYVVKKKISPGTFHVEDLADKQRDLPFRQPLAAERLVKLDMPELELAPNQPRRVEMRERPGEAFSVYKIERYSQDGRVKLTLEDGAPGSGKWVDLTECEYRWLA